MKRVADRAQALVEPICDQLGLELVDVDYRRKGKSWFLTVIVDKSGGISVDDLKQLSKQLGPLLDIEDFVPHHYMLDVSSPGVERPLKQPEHFRRFVGKKAKVVLFETIENRRKFEGKIESVAVVEGCTMIVFALSSGERLEVPFECIRRANLYYTTQELMAGVGRN